MVALGVVEPDTAETGGTAEVAVVSGADESGVADHTPHSCLGRVLLGPMVDNRTSGLFTLIV